jgi:hypothetical protein
MQCEGKIFDNGKKLLANMATGSLLQLWSRFRPFESKFHRDRDFETPVAIFILQVERHAVTTGTAVIRAIEQAEPINNTLVNRARDHLIVAVIAIETRLWGH